MLFIFSDDQMINAIGGLGDCLIKTPNFDRLKDSVILFSNAYNKGSFTPCGAVRAGSYVRRRLKGVDRP